MQSAFEKIILPSLVSQGDVPPKLRAFITWVLDNGLPILKESNISAIQNIKKFQIDRSKLEIFLNTYVDQHQINTVEKLKQFRDSHMGISRSLQKEIEDFGKSYAIKHPFQVLSLKGEFESKLAAAKKEINPILKQNGLGQQKLIGCVLGLLVWVIQNFQTNSNPNLNVAQTTRGLETSNEQTAKPSDDTLLFVGIGGLLITAIGVGAFVMLRNKPKKMKRKSFR